MGMVGDRKLIYLLIMSYYQELDIWKKSVEVIKKVYRYTASFPKTEMYSLVDQMKRASISIASNIAEWSGRWSNADNLRFLQMAKWSCSELEAQVIISHELSFLSDTESEDVQSEVTHLLNMISLFIRKKKEYK